MCGRYTLLPNAEQWIAAFKLPREAKQAIETLAPNYNVAPSQAIPIVRNRGETGERELALVHWGLIPFWAKEKSIGYKMINARAETVAAKPAFKNAYRKRQCLVVANGFYEWQKRDGGTKQPYLIRIKDHAPLAFAGLWESWHNPESGSELQSCTIIVTEANDRLKPIHHRMPVILDSQDYESWLDPGSQQAQALLRPCPDEWLEFHPVSTYVNSPQHNDPKCIEPIGSRV